MEHHGNLDLKPYAPSAPRPHSAPKTGKQEVTSPTLFSQRHMAALAPKISAAPGHHPPIREEGGEGPVGGLDPTHLEPKTSRFNPLAVGVDQKVRDTGDDHWGKPLKTNDMSRRMGQVAGPNWGPGRLINPQGVTWMAYGVAFNPLVDIRGVK